MVFFKGFSTINKTKKFGMTDFELIKRDLINAFMIREGEIAGRPDIGSNIWSYIFEPNIEAVRSDIEVEVKKIIKLDPRLEIKELNVSYNANSVTIDIALIITPNTSPEKILLIFNKSTETLDIA